MPHALIFIPGADCPTDSYLKHLSAIQEKVPFPLWVVVPHIVEGECIPPLANYYINKAKEALSKASDNKIKYFFYGGHSLGGASIASWGHSHAKDEGNKGVFAWGSYASKSIDDPVKNYGVPFLTLAGELDGWMARSTRIALSFD